jgi:hypothetical protein
LNSRHKNSEQPAKANHFLNPRTKATFRKKNVNLRLNSRKKNSARVTKANHFLNPRTKATLRKKNVNLRLNSRKKNSEQPAKANQNHFLAPRTKRTSRETNLNLHKTENKVTPRIVDLSLRLKNPPKAAGTTIKILQKKATNKCSPERLP